MIKNIIFDLAGVLIDFNVKNYLKHIGIKENEMDLFIKLIWGSEEWLKGDKGDYSPEDTINAICKKNPNYSKQLRYILENKDNHFILSEIPANCLYLKELKDRGFKLYFLSNVNPVDLKYDKDNFSIFDLVDGEVYSCDVGYVKPEKYIYEIILEKYNLIPDESIFIDDNIKNVEAATNIGINSIYHRSLEGTKEEVQKIINKFNDVC